MAEVKAVNHRPAESATRTYQVIQAVVMLRDTPAAETALDLVRALAGDECVTITPADDPPGTNVAAISVAEELDLVEAQAIQQAIYALTPHLVGAARVVRDVDGAPGSFHIGTPVNIQRLRPEHSSQGIVEWAMQVETPALRTLIERLRQIVAAREDK